MKFPFRKRTTKKYVVCVNERWHRFYEVEAENTNDARDTWVVADPDTGEVLYE
jgi:phospholipase C